MLLTPSAAAESASNAHDAAVGPLRQLPELGYDVFKHKTRYWFLEEWRKVDGERRGHAVAALELDGGRVRRDGAKGASGRRWDGPQPCLRNGWDVEGESTAVVGVVLAQDVLLRRR